MKQIIREELFEVVISIQFAPSYKRGFIRKSFVREFNQSAFVREFRDSVVRESKSWAFRCGVLSSRQLKLKK
jgi:hypothetical protein